MTHSLLSDADLLERFSRNRDDDAFGELVRRHLGWVHSTAIRLMSGDEFVAEEVAQDVFTDLARKSGRLALELRGGKPLVGWLHSGVRLAASNYRRTHSRRMARELRARVHNEMEPMPLKNDSTAEWEEIRPLIDEALAELSPQERDAVLMRFFQEKDLRSIGHAFGVSEDAARKRVDRALDRLRTWMGSRGVQTTAAALLSAVMAHGVAPLPAGLSERIASKAVLSHGGAFQVLQARWNLGALVGTILVGLIAWGTYQRMHSPEASIPTVQAVQTPTAIVHQTRSVSSINTTASAPEERSRNPRTVRIPKTFLDRFSFPSVMMTSLRDRRFVPSKRFVTLFRLTPSEVEGVVAAIDKALDKYRTIEGQRLTPVATSESNPVAPPSPPNSPASRVDVIERRQFTLKPFPEESLAIHQELEAAIISILGTQRGAAFVRMGAALKGEMKTFETTQTIQGHTAKMAIATLYTFRLVQLDQGPIVDLEHSYSGGSDGSPYGEEMYRYVPEGLKSDLARWRMYIREKGSTYFESPAAELDPNQDPPMGPLEDSVDYGSWDEEALTLEIPMEWLRSLGIAGLMPGEVISEDAIQLCGLTEAEVAQATNVYTQMKERFLDLERKHFVRTSSNSFAFIVQAFPGEKFVLHQEFAQTLRSQLGDERGEMLYSLILTPMSMEISSNWMRKAMPGHQRLDYLEEMLGKRWMDRGDDEIHLKLVQVGSGWRVEQRSLTDPNDVGAATLNWSRVPLRWRHLLTRDLVEPSAVNDRE